MIGEFFAMMLGLSPGYIGDCVEYHHDMVVHTECNYPESSDDRELISVIGKLWMTGPWADPVADIVHPAELILAQKSTIVVNADIGGSALLTIREPGWLMHGITFRPLDAEFSWVSIKDGQTD